MGQWVFLQASIVDLYVCGGGHVCRETFFWILL